MLVQRDCSRAASEAPPAAQARAAAPAQRTQRFSARASCAILHHSPPSPRRPPLVTCRARHAGVVRAGTPAPPHVDPSQPICPKTPHTACHERCTSHGAPHSNLESPAQSTPVRARNPPCTLLACKRQALDAWSADVRVSFCGRCFKLLAPTSHTTSLAVSDRRLRSFMLCVSGCGSFMSRHVCFQRLSVLVCVLFEHHSVGVCGSQCAKKALELAFWSAAACQIVTFNRRVICDRERGGVAQDGSVCHRAWSRVERNDHFFSRSLREHRLSKRK